MTEDQKTLLAALDGDGFVFDPTRLVIASDMMQEWLDSGDVPGDVRQDFALARDCMEALYVHISRLPARSA